MDSRDLVCGGLERAAVAIQNDQVEAALGELTPLGAGPDGPPAMRAHRP
jgi:hypothetical protein